MKGRFFTWIAAGWLAVLPAMARPQPAVDGILAAFRTHPLVGLADMHGLAQEEDFFATLVRDPRFARTVRDVVVEFGSAANQPLLDRYLAGETLTPVQVRALASDRVSWVPSGVSTGYADFFTAVRSVNQALPPDRRIRVWMGDPPIDWTRVRSKADWLPILRQRDPFPAALIEREILSKGRKALVIYGGDHFYNRPEDPLLNLGPLLQQPHPEVLFIVTPYIGFNEKSCSAMFEQSHAWQSPALIDVHEVAGVLRAPGCHAAPVGRPAWEDERFSGAAGDALLYLGPAASLNDAAVQPDIYSDPAYRAEMSRRREIILGKPLDDANAGSLTPHPLRP